MIKFSDSFAFYSISQYGIDIEKDNFNSSIEIDGQMTLDQVLPSS